MSFNFGTGNEHPVNGFLHLQSGLFSRRFHANGHGLRSGSRFYGSVLYDNPSSSEEIGLCDDEETSGGLHSKKRRLSVQQVRSLETSFETESKLEPERKMQLAAELGLQPRQVAVWFQNRRARWKTKQLERDYDDLKQQYDEVVAEKKKLEGQVARLTQEVVAAKGEKRDQNTLITAKSEEENGLQKTTTTTTEEMQSTSPSFCSDADSNRKLLLSSPSCNIQAAAYKTDEENEKENLQVLYSSDFHDQLDMYRYLMAAEEQPHHGPDWLNFENL